MKNLNKNKLDIFILSALIILWVLYSYLTKNLLIGKAVISGAAYLLPATIYLGLRKSKNWKKILVSTLVFGGLFGFVFEFIAEYTKSYSVVSLVTPFKILGVLPPANVIDHMMMAMFTVTFYEHFIDREKNPHISKNLKYALLPSIFAILVLVTIYLFKPSILSFNLPYLYMGIGALIPLIFLGFKRPKLIRKMAETAIYFFFLYFIFEIVAVQLRWWIYPGNNYVGWVTIFNTTFPFEELFFWMMFYAASLVSYYEIFVDDES